MAFGRTTIQLLYIIMLCFFMIVSSSIISMKQFVCRICPSQCHAINITLVQHQNGSDFVELHTEGKTDVLALQIKASSKSALVMGLGYYLRVYCNTSFTQFGLSNQDFSIVGLSSTLTLTVNNLVRYYGNICVYSYSYWTWNWDTWESHIDWIVFRGFNLVFIPTGIELINLEVFRALGLCDDKIYEFFNGPAYLAWSRMGNMKNFSAPITPQFIQHQAALQKNISSRLTELGVKVAIPGFSGFVPAALMKLYNETFFNNVSCWNSFNETFSCLKQLDPTKELYNIVGNLYMKVLLKTFKTNHIYAVDMFNENTPRNSSLEYLQCCGENTVSVIRSVDSLGIWLLQGWTFGYDTFWNYARVGAYLKNVKNNEVLILDMFAEVKPTWNRTDSFFGKPFIWTVINNFGGNTVINGNVKQILNGFTFAMNSSKSLIGIGFMPEGIHENTILLDAMMQYTSLNAQSMSPLVFYEGWKDRISRYRYSGYKGDTVKQFIEKLYNHRNKGPFTDSCIIYRRPYFDMPFNPNSHFSDNIVLLKKYLDIIDHKQVNGFSDVFIYDLSSVTQNFAEQVFNLNYRVLLIAYHGRDVNQFDHCAYTMNETIALLDDTFSLIPLRSLPCYQEQVKRFALLVQDRPLKLAHDFRLQLTMWGYNAEVLDYAFKMWSGLLNRYYGPRWLTFIDYLRTSLVNDAPFDGKGYEAKVKSIEKQFVEDNYSEKCMDWDDTSVLKIADLIRKLL